MLSAELNSSRRRGFEPSKSSLAALAVVLTLLPGSVSQAVQGSNDRIDHLRLVVRTGSDDLRGGAVVYGQIRLRGGRTLPRVNLNRGARWRDNSTQDVRMSLGSRMRLGLLDGATLTLFHDGAGRNFGEGYDNWNLNSIRVATPRVCTGGVSVARASGRPWHRFTGKRTSRTLRFRVPGHARKQKVRELMITLRTGSDDLRAGAVAYAQIRLKNGNTLPRDNLNQGGQWRNQSSRTIQMRFPRQIRLGDLKSIRFSHDGAGRNFGETYDNWNLDSVNVQTRRSCGSRTIARKRGNPWVRFTGSRTSASFKLSTGN